MEESGAHDVEVYRAIVDACPSAVVVTDRSGRVLLLNATAATMHGYAAGELLGVVMEDVLLPERLRERRRVWRERYFDLPEDRPMLLDGVETIGLRRDGTEFPVEMNATSVVMDGEPALLAYLADVTVQRQLEREASAVSDELVANVSHELRTPLTSIIGYTELLADVVEEEVDDPDLRSELTRMIQVVERNAARERSLVEDLLTTAFLDTDGPRVTLAPVDLNAVLREVVEDHLPAAHDVGVTLVLTEDPAVGRVLGDHLRLNEVFTNLVTNAVKFTDAGGRVRASVHDAGRLASVEVADTGCGIRPEDLPRLFDRLYRSPSAVAAQKQGAGLGLAIVKRIVDAHDGHVSVRSTPGHGTLVQVDLPYADPAGPAAPVPPGSTAP